MYLHGNSDHGDAVEDEWLIVYILRELTKSFPGIWVRISDSDGEFLLIEAANAVPSWLNPDVDQNRVWLHGGQLLIIPVADRDSSDPKALSLPDAVGIIRAAPETLTHLPLVEDEAFYRLQKYPSQISQAIHHSLIIIPRRLAYILHALPRSVAPAVEAFYLRDPLATKAISGESIALHLPPDDVVTVSVRFSRVLFAQLKS